MEFVASIPYGEITAGIAFGVFALVCIGVTLIGLPGTWLMLGAALSIEALDVPLFGWWALGIAGGLAILAEVAETMSGAAGASAAGASRRAAVGAIVGGIIGAIGGTFLIPIPVIGSIVGSVVGAAAGAMGMELSKHQSIRTSTSVLAVGKGAAIGRMLATVIKSAFALAMAITLIVAMFL
jgi:uncharacterized protein YqgC (DUF456 family)